MVGPVARVMMTRFTNHASPLHDIIHCIGGTSTCTSATHPIMPGCTVREFTWPRHLEGAPVGLVVWCIDNEHGKKVITVMWSG